MFTDFTPIRGSIWKQKVNTYIGLAFIGTCALWAGLVVVQASSGENPLANAFASVIVQETSIR